MDISKVNDLLGQVRVRLESLDPNNTDENIQTMNSVDPKSLSTANSKLANLISKLSPGGRKPRATGSGKRR
jgi:hypothetical protein